MNKDCLFCKIAEKQIPSERVFENENIVGFKDIYPQAPTHILFIPKAHIQSLAHLQQNQLGIIQDLYTCALDFAKAQGLSERGFRTVINTGKDGGQTVSHLHLHLLSSASISAKFA